MDLSFWQLCILVAISAIPASAGLFALRVAVNLDLNAWIKRRDERRMSQVRALCPHVALKTVVDPCSGEKRIRAIGPTSPPGSRDFVCQRCGQSFIGGEHQAQEFVELYMRNPDLRMKDEERFEKAAKKLKDSSKVPEKGPTDVGVPLPWALFDIVPSIMDNIMQRRERVLAALTALFYELPEPPEGIEITEDNALEFATIYLCLPRREREIVSSWGPREGGTIAMSEFREQHHPELQWIARRMWRRATLFRWLRKGPEFSSWQGTKGN